MASPGLWCVVVAPGVDGGELELTDIGHLTARAIEHVQSATLGTMIPDGAIAVCEQLISTLSLRTSQIKSEVADWPLTERIARPRPTGSGH